MESQGDFSYSPSNLTNERRENTWAEGVDGDGIGESIEIRHLYMGTIVLEDTIKPQYIDITPLQMTVGNGREAKFRFEIAEVYEGTKYEDTCITGIVIEFDGRYGH